MLKYLGQAFHQHIGRPCWRFGTRFIPDRPHRKRSWLYLRKALALWLGRDKTMVWLTCDQPDIQGGEPVAIRGPTVFRGWALSTRGIASVTFSCDGIVLGEACRGQPRPDVVALASHLRQSSRCGFHYLLDPRSIAAGSHELTIKAQSYGAASVSATCKIEVIRSRDDYAAWRRKRAVTPGTVAWMKRHVDFLLDRPSITLFMKLNAAVELGSLFTTIRSLQEQVYPHWRMHVYCDKASFEKLGESLGRLTAQDSRIDVYVESPNDAVDSSGSVCVRAEDDLWGLIDAGDVLDPNALFEAVYQLNRDPQIDFIYTDEDSLLGREVRDFPVLKPDWSSELFASGTGIGRLWLARQRLVPEAAGCGPAANSIEERRLLLKLTQKAQKIGHIKSVLYGRHLTPGQIRPMAAHYSMAADARTVIAGAPLPMMKLEGIENILLVMLDHLGDVLLTFPAIERLRQMFPQAHITALVGSWSESLARGNESIDEILTYDFFDASSAEPHRRIDAVEADRIEQWLSPGGFDLAVDFRREPETRDFLRLSRARYTAGFAQGKEAAWLTVALPCEPNVQWLRPRRHVAQELIHLVEMIGVAGRADIRPRLAIAPGEDFAVKELLVAALPDDGRLLVAIHPGSGRSIKCWPAEHFAGLADRLTERLQARIVWFGSKNEMALVDSILEQMRFRSEAVSLAGRLSIAQLAAAFRHFDLFIGNDSGPTHLAAGTGMPTLCICSGTIDPIQWAPLGPAALVVYRLMTCSPCYLRDREECPFEVACLRELGVAEVWEAALRTLLPRWHKLVHTPEFAQAKRTVAPHGIRKPADVSAAFPSA